MHAEVEPDVNTRTHTQTQRGAFSFSQGTCSRIVAAHYIASLLSLPIRGQRISSRTGFRGGREVLQSFGSTLNKRTLQCWARLEARTMPIYERRRTAGLASCAGPMRRVSSGIRAMDPDVNLDNHPQQKLPLPASSELHGGFED